MNTQEILDLIEDPPISDEEVFDALLDYVSDRKDADGRIVPSTNQDPEEIQKVSQKIKQLRPSVMGKMLDHVAREHENCHKPRS